MVVNSQPTPVIATTVVRPAGDYYLTLSIVLTSICIFCGTWYSLFCTVPAIFIAISVSLSEAFVIFIIITGTYRLGILQPKVIFKEHSQKVVLLSF